MGKSTVGALFEKAGFPVVDTDELARVVVEPGRPALEKIKRIFGDHYINPDGTLNRKALGDLVFNNEQARKTLEGILHPEIRQLWFDEVTKWRLEDRTAGAVIVPLLFETAAESYFDAVICVACSKQTQMERLRERGWDDQQINSRIKAQLPTEEKIARSNYVIWNDAGFDVCEEQLRKIIENALRC